MPLTRLREVLVGRADHHLFDPRIRRGPHRRRGQRIIRLVLDHRPHPHAERRERLLEQAELRQQVGIDAGAGLVSGPEAVAERLDDVIGGNADVGRAAIDHAEHRADHATRRAHFPALLVTRGGHGVEVAEQLVGAVDEVDFQSLIPNR